MENACLHFQSLIMTVHYGTDGPCACAIEKLSHCTSLLLTHPQVVSSNLVKDVLGDPKKSAVEITKVMSGMTEDYKETCQNRDSSDTGSRKRKHVV